MVFLLPELLKMRNGSYYALRWICLLGILLLACCKSLSSYDNSPSSPPKSEDHFTMALSQNALGTVTVINQLHHFVLLNTRSCPPPGTFLACISGSQQTALLRVAPPSRPPFLIADIIQGDPTIGEKVFLAKSHSVVNAKN